MDIKPTTALGVAFVLALGALVSTWVAADTFYELRNTNTISITGSVEKTVTSDIVKWRSYYSRENSELSKGLAELASDEAAVRKYLGGKGVAENELTFDPPFFFDKYENQCSQTENGEECTQVKTGYTFQQNFIVESTKVAEIQKLALESVSDLVALGLAFTSNNPEYYYSDTKMRETKFAILGEAAADAKKRAAEIAEAAGADLGQLQSASMGVFQITPVNSSDFSDYGVYDTTTVEKSVKGVVRAKFTLR